MTFYFERLVDFVGAHPQLSFLAVFLLALSEAVPVVGTVVPGSTLILAISALATTAGVTPWGLLVAAAVGAIAGDGFSFWLGHRYHRQILRGWPLNRFPWLIERSAQLIRKYGIASVFLARFTAVVRAFVPLLAGIMRMSSSHFYVANILSALVWAPIHIFPGVLVGVAIAFGGAHAPELSLAAIGVLILAWIAWRMIERKTASIMECPGNLNAPGSGSRASAPRPVAPRTAPEAARLQDPGESATDATRQHAKARGTLGDSARLLFSRFPRGTRDDRHSHRLASTIRRQRS
jgi:membrane protein DedA with SNARE-associated domain